MDHSHAVLHHFAEQYLLGELSSEQRDEFEEHFFDCQECAAELRVTRAFLQSARDELRKSGLSGVPAGPALVPTSGRPSDAKVPKPDHWRPAVAWAALAASLLVVAYQNVVTFPRLRNEVASLERPEVLPSISLTGENSRGGGVPSATGNGAGSVILQVDIPSEPRFSSYLCSLYSPAHHQIWTAQISAQEARDTVFLRVPLPRDANGLYTLNVRGNQEGSSAATGVDVATYPFTINAGDAGETHKDKTKPE